MHLIFYTHSVLDLGSFSTAVSYTIIGGALYGALRGVVDLYHSFTRGNFRVKWSDARAWPPPETETPGVLMRAAAAPGVPPLP